MLVVLDAGVEYRVPDTGSWILTTQVWPDRSSFMLLPSRAVCSMIGGQAQLVAVVGRMTTNILWPVIAAVCCVQGATFQLSGVSTPVFNTEGLIHVFSC
jgi:hypothetical protein